MFLFLSLLVIAVGCSSKESEVSTATENNETEQKQSVETVATETSNNEEKSEFEIQLEKAASENTMSEEEMLTEGRKLLELMNKAYTAPTEEESIKLIEQTYANLEVWTPAVLSYYGTVKELTFDIKKEEVSKINKDAFLYIATIKERIVSLDGKEVFEDSVYQIEIHKTEIGFRIININAY